MFVLSLTFLRTGPYLRVIFQHLLSSVAMNSFIFSPPAIFPLPTILSFSLDGIDGLDFVFIVFMLKTEQCWVGKLQ